MVTFAINSGTEQGTAVAPSPLREAVVTPYREVVVVRGVNKLLADAGLNMQCSRLDELGSILQSAAQLLKERGTEGALQTVKLYKAATALCQRTLEPPIRTAPLTLEEGNIQKVYDVHHRLEMAGVRVSGINQFLNFKTLELFKPGTQALSSIERLYDGPDNQALAAVKIGDRLGIVDLRTKELLPLPEEAISDLGSIHFGPNGARYATVTIDKVSHLLNLSTGKFARVAGEKVVTANTPFFLPDGSAFVDREIEGGKQLVNIAKEEAAVLPVTAGGKFEGAAQMPDYSAKVVFVMPNEVEFIDLATANKFVFQMQTEGAQGLGESYGPTQQFIFGVKNKEKYFFLDLKNNQGQSLPLTQGEFAELYAFGDKGESFPIFIKAGELKLLSMKTGELLDFGSPEVLAAGKLYVNSERHQVAASNVAGVPYVFDLANQCLTDLSPYGILKVDSECRVVGNSLLINTGQGQERKLFDLQTKKFVTSAGDELQNTYNFHVDKQQRTYVGCKINGQEQLVCLDNHKRLSLDGYWLDDRERPHFGPDGQGYLLVQTASGRKILDLKRDQLIESPGIGIGRLEDVIFASPSEVYLNLQINKAPSTEQILFRIA